MVLTFGRSRRNKRSAQASAEASGPGTVEAAPALPAAATTSIQGTPTRVKGAAHQAGVTMMTTTTTTTTWPAAMPPQRTSSLSLHARGRSDDSVRHPGLLRWDAQTSSAGPSSEFSRASASFPASRRTSAHLHDLDIDHLHQRLHHSREHSYEQPDPLRYVPQHRRHHSHVGDPARQQGQRTPNTNTNTAPQQLRRPNDHYFFSRRQEGSELRASGVDATIIRPGETAAIDFYQQQPSAAPPDVRFAGLDAAYTQSEPTRPVRQTDLKQHHNLLTTGASSPATDTRPTTLTTTTTTTLNDNNGYRNNLPGYNLAQQQRLTHANSTLISVPGAAPLAKIASDSQQQQQQQQRDSLNAHHFQQQSSGSSSRQSYFLPSVISSFTTNEHDPSHSRFTVQQLSSTQVSTAPTLRVSDDDPQPAHRSSHFAEGPLAAPAAEHPPASATQSTDKRKQRSRFSLRSAFDSLLSQPSTILGKKKEQPREASATLAPPARPPLRAQEDSAVAAMYLPSQQAQGSAEVLRSSEMLPHRGHQDGRPSQLPRAAKAEPFPSTWHSSEEEGTDGSSSNFANEVNRRIRLASSGGGGGGGGGVGGRMRSATATSGYVPGIGGASRQQPAHGGLKRGGSLTVSAAPSSLASGPPSHASFRDEDDVLPAQSQGVTAPRRMIGAQTSRSSIIDHTHAPNASLQVQLLDPRTGSYALHQQQNTTDSTDGMRSAASSSPTAFSRPLAASRHRLSSRASAGEAGLVQAVVHEDRREDALSALSSPRSSLLLPTQEVEPTKPPKPLSTLRKFFTSRTARMSNPTPVPNGLVQPGAQGPRHSEPEKRSQLPVPTRAHSSMDAPTVTPSPLQAVLTNKRLSLGAQAVPSSLGGVYTHYESAGAGREAGTGTNSRAASPPPMRLRASDSWTDDQRAMLLPTVVPGSSLPTSPTRARAGSMRKRDTTAGSSDRLRFQRKPPMAASSGSVNGTSAAQIEAAAAALASGLGGHSSNVSRSASMNTFSSTRSTDRALTLQALKGASAVGPASTPEPTSAANPLGRIGTTPTMWNHADGVAGSGSRSGDGLSPIAPSEGPSVSALSYKTASPQLSDVPSQGVSPSSYNNHYHSSPATAEGRHGSSSSFNVDTPRMDPSSIIRPSDPVMHSGGRRNEKKFPGQARDSSFQSSPSSSVPLESILAEYKRRNTFGNEAAGTVSDALRSDSDFQHAIAAAGAMPNDLASPGAPSLQESFVLEIERDLRAVEKALINNRREGSFDPTSLRKRLSTTPRATARAQEDDSVDMPDGLVMGESQGGLRAGRNRVTLSVGSQLAILDSVRRLKTTIDQSHIRDENAIAETSAEAPVPLMPNEVGEPSLDVSNASKLSAHQKGLREIELAYDRMRDLVTSAIGVSAASPPIVPPAVKRIQIQTQASPLAQDSPAGPSRTRTQSTTAIPTPAPPLASPIRGPLFPSDSSRSRRLSALMGLPHPREASGATSHGDDAEGLADGLDGRVAAEREPVVDDFVVQPSPSQHVKRASATGSTGQRSSIPGPPRAHANSVGSGAGSSAAAATRRRSASRTGREEQPQHYLHQLRQHQHQRAMSSNESPRSLPLSIGSPAMTFGHFQGTTEFGAGDLVVLPRGALGMSPSTAARSLPSARGYHGAIRSPWTVSSGLTSVFNSGEGAAISEPDDPALEMLRRRHELERNSLLDALEQTRAENAHLHTANGQLQSDLHAEVTRVLQLERELQRQLEHEQTLGTRLEEMARHIAELQTELEHHRLTNVLPGPSILERYELSISRLPPGHSPIGLSDVSDAGSDPTGSHGAKVDDGARGRQAVVSLTNQSATTSQGVSTPLVSAVVDAQPSRPRPTSSPSLHNYPSVLGLQMDEQELRWTLADEQLPRGGSVSPNKRHSSALDEQEISGVDEDLLTAPFPSIPTRQFLERNTRMRETPRESPVAGSSNISNSPNSFNVSGVSSIDRTTAPSESVVGSGAGAGARDPSGSGSLRGLGVHTGGSGGVGASVGLGPGSTGGLKPSSLSSSGGRRSTSSRHEDGGGDGRDSGAAERLAPSARATGCETRKVSAATTGASSSFTAQTESPAASFVSGFGPVSKTFRELLQEDDDAV